MASVAAFRLQVRNEKFKVWDKRIQRFIALTQFGKDKFIEGGLPPEKITVKPNFIKDPGRPNNENRSGALFVGRLSKEKGVIHLVEAWRSIPNVALKIVGDGPEIELLKARAPSNVTFMGWKNSEGVLTEMAKAKALILPSIYYEGFPVIIAEAFASGLPVMASNLGAMKEVIEDGVTGRLFKPACPEDLAKRVGDAFEETGQLDEMSKAARCKYEAEFTPRANLDQLIEIYHQARMEMIPAAP